MADTADAFFGRIAVREGLATEDQVQACMAEKKRLGDLGKTRQIHSVMIDQGILSPEQVEHLLSRQNKRSLRCPACERTYTVLGLPAGKTIACKSCGEPLVDSPPKDLHQSTIVGLPPVAEQLDSTALQGGVGQADDGYLPEEDPLLGLVLNDKYRIDERIGAGAFGWVYVARHIKLDRDCAVKILPQQLACDATLVERFRREATLTAQLDDQSNVVTVYDVNKDHGYMYIAMEYIQGESLAEVQKKLTCLPWDDAVELIVQAAKGLAAAHERGILHRDVKPANLMINEHRIIKVMDFGLARLAAGAGHLSSTGQVLGTPHFMSPEQANGIDLDAKTDIYSLGSTLYYVVTGETPFDGNTPTAILLKLIEKEPEPPHAVNPEVPLPVSAVIMRMMAKRPEDRYESMGACASALELLLAGEDPEEGELRPPPSAAPAPADGRRARMRRRHLRLWLMMAGMWVVSIGLAGVVWYQMTRTDERVEAPPRRSAPDQAFTELAQILIRDDRTDDFKVGACEAFINLYPDAPQADQVRENLARLQRRIRLARTKGRGTPRRTTGRSPGVTASQRKAKRIGRLRTEIELARGDEDVDEVRRLLGELRDLGAEDLDGYQEWLTNAEVPPPPSTRVLDTLIWKARQALIDDELTSAKSQIYDIRQKEGLNQSQRDQLTELQSVVTTHQQLQARQTPSVADRDKARLFWVRLADEALTRRDTRTGTRLLRKALTVATTSKVEGGLNRRLGDLAMAAGRDVEALNLYGKAYANGLRDDVFVERYGITAFAHGRYATAAACCTRLFESSKGARFGTGFLACVAYLELDQVEPARKLALTLYESAIPLPAALTKRFGLVPDLTDRLILKSGTQVSGRIVSSTKTVVMFSWIEGASQRIKPFRKDKVARLVRGGMTSEKLETELDKVTRLSLARMAGLLVYARLNGHREATKLLDERIALRRRIALKGLGAACDTCQARGRLPFDCADCGGAGYTMSDCTRCDGAGNLPCTRCRGNGMITCPGRCGGSGSVVVDPQSGKTRTCGDCRGKGEIRCLRCHGNKTGPCGDCKGKRRKRTNCRCGAKKHTPCRDCERTGVSLTAWPAIQLGMGYSKLRAAAEARPFWAAMRGSADTLTSARRTWMARLLRKMGLDGPAADLEP